MAEKIYILSEEQAREIALEAARLAVEMARKSETSSEIMTVKTLAKYLNCSEAHVRNKMKEGLPCNRKLGVPRFFKSEVIKWLSEG